MGSDIVIRIQHAEGRTQPLERLRSLLPLAEVITDGPASDPNPWRGFKRCMTDLPTSGHVVVIQDDTIVCRNFITAIEAISKSVSQSVVCLFVPGVQKRTAVSMRKASMAGRAYAPIHQADFVPVVCTLWPVDKAREMMSWTEENPKRLGHHNPRSDDAVIGRWMRFTRQEVLVTVPSLVEHPDDVPSTIGTRAKSGGDRGRLASWWIGDGDPMAINWSRI